MSLKISISSGSWQLDLSMKITVHDQEKFITCCEKINKFWGGAEDRKAHHGSHSKAGLALFAAECFEQVAFSHLKNEEWLTKQFAKGIEGFPSLEQMGASIDSIDNMGIDSDEIEIVGL